MTIVRLAAILALVTTCFSPGEYRCATSTECVNLEGTSGQCEPNGLCSFPDSSCPSGHRFGPSGNGALDGTCTTSDIDAPFADAPIDGMPDACVALPSETCNGLDDDCDMEIDEGFGLGDPCDGTDSDLCQEGATVCDLTGAVTCGDSTGDTVELCNGADEDCDLAIDNGYALGVACDGTDSDFCNEGVTVCNVAGTGTTCDDATGNTTETCNGVDDDCDLAIDNGFALGGMCDGADTDLCQEGTMVCNGAGTGTQCSDTTGNTVETCNGIDDDCNIATADGANDPLLGTVCDGTDTDLCTEGTRVCSGGALSCNDANDADPDVCNGVDDDCSGGTADGSADPLLGTVCDGTDADLCTEGTRSCSGGALVCGDANDADPDVCNGIDDDCNGGTGDGSGDPLLGTVCDGTDADLCTEGVRLCSGGVLSCNDTNDADPDVCNGVDDDCNGATADGSADPLLGSVCDGTDADACLEGTRFCSGGALACNDPNDADPEVCNGLDDNCVGGIDEGGVCGNDECISATAITLLAGTTTVSDTTATATPSANSCQPAKDRWYSFTLATREIVYVDTFGSGYDTYVGFATACGTPATGCTNDSCASAQTQLTNVFDAGTYYIVVDGFSTAAGPYTLRIQHLPVAGNASGTIAAGAYSFTGTTAGGASSFTGCNGTGPERWYSYLSCPAYAGGTFTATTCNASTTYDSVLGFNNGSTGANPTACNDDFCGLQSNLSTAATAGAGVHVLYMDGFGGASGPYVVTGNRP